MRQSPGLLPFLFLGLLASLAAPVRTGDPDVVLIRKRFEQLFERVADVSKANPPEFINAASGRFRDRLVDRLNSERKLKPEGYDHKLSVDGQRLADLYDAQYLVFQRSFGWNRNFPASWRHSPVIRYEIGASLAAHWPTIGFTIVAVAAADVMGQVAAELLAQEMVEMVKNPQVQITGVAPHGKISVDLHNGAVDTTARIDRAFAGHFDSEAGKVAKVLRSANEQMRDQLSTRSHNPWLRPDWQVQFTEICDWTAGALER